MKAEESVRSFQRHLRALLRAELLIAEIKLNALLKKTMLMAVAGVIAVFGLATQTAVEKISRRSRDQMGSDRFGKLF